MDIRYSKMLKWFRHNHPDEIDRFIESVSPNQILCKDWLVKELFKISQLHKRPLRIEIIGSWFGWPLVEMLNENFDIERIRLYDIDPFANKVARKYAEIFEFDFEITAFDFDYWKHEQNCVVACELLINTSSEHMEENLEVFPRDYAKKPIVAVQSNNMYDEADHVNCVDNEFELAALNGMKYPIYAGSLELDSYERFMCIQ